VGTIKWYVPKSNGHFRALCGRKSAPNGHFILLILEHISLKVPTFNLKP
jgi:hypothetical protein